MIVVKGFLGWDVGHIKALSNGGNNDHANIRAEYWLNNQTRRSKDGNWCPID